MKSQLDCRPEVDEPLNTILELGFRLEIRSWTATSENRPGMTVLTAGFYCRLAMQVGHQTCAAS